MDPKAAELYQEEQLQLLRNIESALTAAKVGHNMRGEFIQERQYQPLDVVRIDSTYYIASAETTDHPSKSPHWQSVKEMLTPVKGDKGDDGRDGKDVDMQKVESLIVQEAAKHPGRDGRDGKDGKSIKGDPGPPGKDGKSIKGEKGDKGDDGKSAYEIWLEQGNRGSKADYLASLKGATYVPGAGSRVPNGGTAGQVLKKNSNANQDVSWGTQTLAAISDVTASATELNYVDGVTSPIQTQLDAKASATGLSTEISDRAAADTALSSRLDAVEYQPEEANRLAAGQETFSRIYATGNGIAITSGVLKLAYLTAFRSETINSLKVNTGGTGAAATPTLCRLGLYSVAGNGDLTLIASTANDTTLFSSANTGYTKALTSGVAVTKGQRYAVAILVVSGTTMPSLAGIGISISLGGESPRVYGQVNAQADLPASISAGSIVNGAQLHYAVMVP